MSRAVFFEAAHPVHLAKLGAVPGRCGQHAGRVHEHFLDFATVSATVRPGRLYRVGWTLLAGCPVGMEAVPGAVLIDLRSAVEMTPLVGAVSIPIDVPGVVARLGGRPADAEYSALYVDTVDLCGPEIVGVVTAVAGAAGPVALGCSLGKDRTGLVVALLGVLVGVSEAEVLAGDVLARRGIFGCEAAVRTYAAGRGFAVDEFVRRCSLGDSALRFALEHVRVRYGGVEKYLLANGLDASTVDSLRASLLK